MSGDSVRVALPLFQTESGGSIPASPLQLIYERCSRKHAAILNELWHSRLPVVDWKTLSLAFHARYEDVSYGIALWGNPCARELPNNYLELRRMAVAPDAPKNTASSFLSWMTRYIRKMGKYTKLISYQDIEVHNGTIYKASNWKVGYVSKPMKRDRTKFRIGTKSFYRNPQNGLAVDWSSKIRWEFDL